MNKALIKSLFKFDFFKLGIILIFFACPLRAYLPTSFIVEFIAIVIFLFCMNSKVGNGIEVKTKRNSIALACVMVVIFILGMLGNYDDFCFKENYRFFVQFVFLAIFINSSYDNERALKIAFWLCVLHIPFTVYELIHINITSPNDFTGLLITGPAMSTYDEDSQYLLPSEDLGFPMLRPFGLMLQPQKSAFVYVFGIVIKYLLDKKNHEYKNFWYFLFLAAVIASAGKTAILIAFVLLLAILYNVYPSLNVTKGRMITYVILGIVLLLYLLIHTLQITDARAQALGDIGNDLVSILNYPTLEAIFGHGIPSVADMENHGFIVESYLARIVLQLGYLPFLLVCFAATKIYKAKEWKLNYIMLWLVFGLMGHYCVLNTPFFQFLLCVIVCYYKQNKI